MTGWRFWRNVRGRLLGIVLVALAVALALSTYGFNVLFARSTSQSANSLLRARASSELGLLTYEHGRLVAAETTDDALGDSQVWIFGPEGAVEQPNQRTPLDGAAHELAARGGSFLDIPGSDVRLYSAPVVIGGRHLGALVTGISLAPYEAAERRALLGSLALALVMLALVGGAVWWLLEAALRPVVRMTEQVAAWSDHDLDRRFDLGEPHDELTRLAATLDGLLDRISASLRHERRFSAELSHELRTPLARTIAEAELALRRERDPSEYRAALEVTLRNSQQVARIVEALVTAAQHEAGAVPGTADAYAVATDAVDGIGGLTGDREVELTAEAPPAPLRLGVDGDLAERVLHPVIENACRYGRSWARVSITRRGSTILYVVEDDGPGVATEELETIFEPGVRGLAGRNGAGSNGAGLGLALARRLARTASGDVAAEAAAGGRFLVSLPSA
jgi:two-component system, OmpR family, sensor kinase